VEFVLKISTKRKSRPAKAFQIPQNFIPQVFHKRIVENVENLNCGKYGGKIK